eukprot:759571-Hanusia_phi.AAC.2
MGVLIDLLESDRLAMDKSLRKIMELPDETKVGHSRIVRTLYDKCSQVFPAHMMPTTIGRERRSNPSLARALERIDRSTVHQSQKEQNSMEMKFSV